MSLCTASFQIFTNGKLPFGGMCLFIMCKQKDSDHVKCKEKEGDEIRFISEPIKFKSIYEQIYVSQFMMVIGLKLAQLIQ